MMHPPQELLDFLLLYIAESQLDMEHVPPEFLTECCLQNLM